jgi:hypothetical protein
MYPESAVEDWNIIVQVVLNQSGLSKALYERGIVKSVNGELPAFARAFGRTQGLFSFVDVGTGKERADHKVREMMRVMLRVSQCRHVFFGPCLDNGYLPFLGEFKGHPAASRISLIETSPASQGFMNLGFSHVSFPDVFRGEPLPEKLPVGAASNVVYRPSSDDMLPPKQASPPPGSESGSWAALSRVNSASTPKTINIAPRKLAAPKFYTVNKAGERLDDDLARWEPGADKKFQAKIKEHGHYCNNFYIKGRCDDVDNCNYYHDDRITAAELLVLRYKARSLKCQNGTYCDDYECFYGHHCRYGKKCTGNPCRFADTHHVIHVSLSLSCDAICYNSDQS